MSNCVSRQAVEEMIKAEMPERGMWEIEGDKEKETVCEVCIDLMQKLSDLPPALSEEIGNSLPVDIYPYTGDKYTVSLDISNIPENIIEGLSQSSMALEWIEDWVDRWVVDNLTNVDHYAIGYENSSLKDKFPIEEDLEDDLER